MAVALAPAYAIAILMTAGPDDGCPSPRQLADALSAHLPGMVLPLGHATGPTTLRLGVTTDAAGAMRLDLSDPEGGPLLHRWLPAAGIWFPGYRCQRIEVRQSSGEILPACLGLEFELADFELQPVPPRYAIRALGNQPVDDRMGIRFRGHAAGLETKARLRKSCLSRGAVTRV